MGTKDRRRREVEETKERILHAARDLFLQHGYEKVTMRAVAEAIEYTPTAIYHHFENKQALVTELCHSDFDRLARHFLKAASITDPIERIRALGEAYLDFADRYPNHYRFMFMTEFPLNEHMEKAAAHAAATATPASGPPTQHADTPEDDAYAFLRRACEEAIQQRRLRPEIVDPGEVAQILWGALHGLISIHIMRRQGPCDVLSDLKTTARRSMEILFRGMLREVKG